MSEKNPFEGLPIANRIAGLRELFRQMFGDRLVWNEWTDHLAKVTLASKEVAVNGPSSSGKTEFFAAWAIARWALEPEETLVLVCSTTLPMLRLRVLGRVFDLFETAKQRLPADIRGEIVESAHSVLLDRTHSAHRNPRGIIGVPVLNSSGTFRGLSSFIGVKAKNVLVIVDEGQLCGRELIDAQTNLLSNRNFQLIVIGNPLGPDTALGIVSKPKAGWASIMHSAPRSRIWDTARGGSALQLCGLDSPNKDGKYPWMIGPQYVEEVRLRYGERSFHWSSWVTAQYDANATSRQVVTAISCEQNQATRRVPGHHPTIWRGASLDPAFIGSEGDRCLLSWGAIRQNDEVAGSNILEIEGYETCPVEQGSVLAVEDQIADHVRRRLVELKIPNANFVFDGTSRAALGVSLGLKLGSVQAMDFGAKPEKDELRLEANKDPSEQFANLTSYCHWLVRELVLGRQLTGMTEEMITELSSRTYDIVTGGKIRLESKSEAKAKLGCSPDIADSIAMLCRLAVQSGAIMPTRLSGYQSTAMDAEMAEWEGINDKGAGWRRAQRTNWAA